MKKILKIIINITLDFVWNAMLLWMGVVIGLVLPYTVIGSTTKVDPLSLWMNYPPDLRWSVFLGVTMIAVCPVIAVSLSDLFCDGVNGTKEFLKRFQKKNPETNT